MKKVVFPLDILPYVAFGSALFHAAVSLLVLIIVQLIYMGHIPLTALLLLLFCFACPCNHRVCLASFLAGCVYSRHRTDYRYLYNGVIIYFRRLFSDQRASGALSNLVGAQSLAEIIEGEEMFWCWGFCRSGKLVFHDGHRAVDCVGRFYLVSENQERIC